MPHTRLSKKHKCTLGLGSDSMLPNKEKGGICRKLKKLLQIAVLHPKTANFVSYPVIVAERQRHITEGSPWVAHPYSMFSLIWSSFMMFVNWAIFIVAPMRFNYVIPKDYYYVTTFDEILFGLQIICLVDIFVKFNVGYSYIDACNVVLTRRRIVWRYLYSWFLIDLLSSFPLLYFKKPMWSLLTMRKRLFINLVPCVRCLRFFSVANDFKIFVKIFKASYIWSRGLHHLMVFIFSIHWCSCVLYVAAMTHLYWYGDADGYCHYLHLQTEEGSFVNASIAYRYHKGVFITCAVFFGTGYSLFNSTRADEIVVNSCILLYGSVFMIYNLVIALNIYINRFNCKLRYQELMNQVEKFMRHKQFPASLMDRVRQFYYYRYQEKYFKEQITMSCLSEQLRSEVALDICHKLIEKVPLFEGMPPSLVGSVLGCLRPEVYMANDLIVRAGDIGNCMYFISSGTVAVFSMKGAEVCHLDDGAHFGELALLMKDRKRVATVVAIEITQVYRLDIKDFRDYITTYKEMYQRVEEIASARMHKTVLIDERFKQRISSGSPEPTINKDGQQNEGFSMPSLLRDNKFDDK